VTQPLPLPEGVSNYAVSGNVLYKSMAPARSMANNAVSDIASADEMVVEEKTENILAEKEAAFFVVEESATFQGSDLNAFRQYLIKQFVFPESLKGKGINGKVIAQFVVDATGKVTKVKILRGVHPEIDKEVIRILENCPVWKPGKQGGKSVSQAFTIPVTIKE
jgi:TonB family protein